MKTQRKKQLEAFGHLLDVMDELREKCPWDRKQTMESLRTLTIEEVYELSDAILSQDLQEIKKELGDVMLHLVFYAKIASETNDFDITDVLQQLTKKLIFRHPHIYGNLKVETQEEVIENWEKLKLKEGNTSVLSGIPASLPALIKANRIQEKVKGIGFEFENAQQVWDKIKEEINEYEAEQNPQLKEEEFGDLLFSMINYARFVGINPDEALSKTNQKFILRFQKLEELAEQNNLVLGEIDLSTLDTLWNEAKKLLV
ncbi:nucleoside triphosphate pyrophosphohydrolase [Weeksella virosa]|uniref:Nucleoside triphosphate pyrophosphohydrolase n=1 Tax=Weeksella virosa (strain ATCC 43766 / DSM 16922 / JCM 21250 / CCUG 30538 / CDC 9751 / IAM 14551 / NBRC 16016 / NCTC 11634 / CL345/78) TaxID=865938 RepID=F0P115_WEEVC|nr:nucleoside triphosphate pyrophosphohydrolase [Weeksella virosa]ADX68599.1 MazG family protein [Weeksella virosa DSM 16922]VEH63738.1 Nucleoside triphosphate pyrophosphohydrolase [Weeksella virosa]